MALKTRLDYRSAENNSIKLIDVEGGPILAEIVLLDSTGNIEVTTADGIFILKPNGWSSDKNRST